MVSCQNRSNLHQFRLGNAFRNSIPKPLLSPFHKVFSSWKSKPSLEQALGESRTGGRGKKRSAQKKIGNKGGGRSLLFWIEVSFLDCLCLGLIFLCYGLVRMPWAMEWIFPKSLCSFSCQVFINTRTSFTKDINFPRISTIQWLTIVNIKVSDVNKTPFTDMYWFTLRLTPVNRNTILRKNYHSKKTWFETKKLKQVGKNIKLNQSINQSIKEKKNRERKTPLGIFFPARVRISTGGGVIRPPSRLRITPLITYQS